MFCRKLQLFWAVLHHVERPPPTRAAWMCVSCVWKRPTMSAGGRTTRSREVPAVRRIAIHDAALMPQDCSSTPGGTLFSTTPGGTRIIYDRKFLLQCRTSPLTRTPPKLPDIPGVTRPLNPDSSSDTNQREQTPNNNSDVHTEENAGEEAQFEMDI